tara:strand:- start:12 stop:305 length:294 start_codon:yes stop_codon:yes gene_type:complete
MNKVDKDVLKEIIYLKDIEAELKSAFKILNTNKCRDYDFGSLECERLGISRVSLLANVLALHKEYILENLEDKPSFAVRFKDKASAELTDLGTSFTI